MEFKQNFMTSGKSDFIRVRSRYYSLGGHYKGVCLQFQKLDLAVTICQDKFLQRVLLKNLSNRTLNT
jgi:hypothetical protein